jgi:hypothetical protein
MTMFEAREDATDELDKRRRFMESAGYRRCDIAACNCGSWHGGNAMARLMEIRDALGQERVNGKTILSAVQELIDYQEFW